MAICPAAVWRTVRANNPGSEERIPKAQAAIPVLSVEDAAGAILQGLESDRERIVEPFMLRLVLSWAHWFPGAGRKMMVRRAWAKA
ncbi:MAG TPA: hypothetical protein VE860_17760 [Chthoniobacterales bacterium]|nr:hypothetical protein [Chthoniobacterales bacterium]